MTDSIINNKSFWKSNPKILITGGYGLVGMAIQKIVKENNIGENFDFVGTKQGDLSNADECRALFEKIKPDYVVNLAAFVGGLFKNLKYPVEFWNINVQINNNVLACAHKYKVKKVISCLSTCIFPDKTAYPIDEDMIHNGPPHNSNETYAYAKRMVDVLNRSYYKEYGNLFTSIIPTNIYGPYDNFSLEDSHVIPALIHKCHLAKEKDQSLTLMGSGKPLRQFIYSEDVAKLIILLLQNYEETSPVILSVDEKDEISIKDLAELVVENFSFKGNVVWDTRKSDGQYKKTASNKKLKSLFPHFKFTSIEEGVAKTCEWFKLNYPEVRK